MDLTYRQKYVIEFAEMINNTGSGICEPITDIDNPGVKWIEKHDSYQGKIFKARSFEYDRRLKYHVLYLREFNLIQ